MSSPIDTRARNSRLTTHDPGIGRPDAAAPWLRLGPDNRGLTTEFVLTSRRRP